MGGTWRVSSDGHLRGDFAPDAVRRMLAKRFRVPPETWDGLLSQRERFELGDMSEFGARQLGKMLRDAGLVVDISDAPSEAQEAADLADMRADAETDAAKPAHPKSILAYHNKRAALHLKIAALILTAAYMARDMLADTSFGLPGIDIGYLPFVVGVLFMTVGCMHFARTKGYPGWVGAVGITGFFGLALMLLLPDRNSPEPGKLVNVGNLVGVVLLLVAAYGTWQMFATRLDTEAITNAARDLRADRHEFPSEYADELSTMAEAEYQELNRFITANVERLEQSSPGPDDAEFLAAISFSEMYRFMGWLRYQSYLRHGDDGALGGDDLDAWGDRIRQRVKRIERRIPDGRARLALRQWLTEFDIGDHHPRGPLSAAQAIINSLRGTKGDVWGANDPESIADERSLEYAAKLATQLRLGRDVTDVLVQNDLVFVYFSTQKRDSFHPEPSDGAGEDDALVLAVLVDAERGDEGVDYRTRISPVRGDLPYWMYPTLHSPLGMSARDRRMMRR